MERPALRAVKTLPSTVFCDMVVRMTVPMSLSAIWALYDPPHNLLMD